MSNTHDRASSHRIALRTAGVLFIAAAVVYVGTEAIAGAAFPGYSYAQNYISDLGVPEVGPYDGRFLDSPLHAVMNAGFLAQGVLFLLATVVAARGLPARPAAPWVGLAALHAVGITLVAFVHGGPQSAASGFIVFHVIGAGLAIVCGNLASIAGGVALGARRFRAFSVGIAAVGLLCLVGLQLQPSLAGADVPDGVWERGSVYAITAWELAAGVVLITRGRAGRQPARDSAA
ncbi:putative membrane protein [Microbacterium sp. SORGH_AS 1204]|uniref:DUF998 domain-containing protein n=1 Tax=Microbacterium sp. SORGH_AS_1204 TaxID=3041785 RepID=UPI00279250F8|nr:DUF998 domain-containing protein [Microbacterium sp. SORGH_AS_1204]MDQ1137301.1 putative membrane protein [Microbacterium sp. SORGH_AS_1204]